MEQLYTELLFGAEQKHKCRLLLHEGCLETVFLFNKDPFVVGTPSSKLLHLSGTVSFPILQWKLQT